MPSLSPEQLQHALKGMAADAAEDSFGAAVSQVVVHGDQRFAPVAVVLTALGAAGAGLDEAAAVALLQTAGAAQLMQSCAALGHSQADHSALVLAVEAMAAHPVAQAAG